jgi:hypothetical protein
MAGLVSTDGSFNAPCALEEAIAGLADRHADLTTKWLGANGYKVPRTLNVPAAFLLELAAVLQIGEWERQGLTAHLDVALPSYRDAADHLVARTKLGPSDFQGPNATRLSDLVNATWIEHFAWKGPALLSADIVFGDCDDDALAEQLASFLWEHHEELQKLNVDS